MWIHYTINEPTHVLGNCASYIDLIFSSKPNLVVDSCVHPSLHPNCHHQIVYANFNLKIHFTSPYEKYGITDKAKRNLLGQYFMNLIDKEQLVN